MAEKKTIALKVTVDTSEVEQSVERTTETVGDLGKTTKKTSSEMKSGFKAAEQNSKSATKGVGGLTSSLGGMLKSLGLIAIAAEIFLFLKDLFMQNQRVADFFSKSLLTIEIVFGKVAKAVENLVDGLRELKDFDIVAIKNQFLEFGKSVSDSADGALELSERVIQLRKEVEKGAATQRLYALTLQTEIEKQRQIRDDISLTIEKRQEANDKIAVLIDQQLKGEQALANQKPLRTISRPWSAG